MNIRTASATIALGVGSLLMLVALSWIFVISPKLGSVSEVSEQRLALEDGNLAMAGQLSTLRAMLEDVPTLTKDAEALAGVIPPTADQPGFFRAITDAAEGAGIPASALTTVSPGVPVLPVAPAPVVAEEGAPAVETAPEPQLAVQTVSINVNGSYKELSKFLGNLEKMERALLLQNISLSSSESGLALTVTGSTFVAPPLGDPPAETP